MCIAAFHVFFKKVLYSYLYVCVCVSVFGGYIS